MEINRSLSINKIGCFVYLYLAIFGPKIGTLLDISFFANLLMLFLCIKRRLIVNKESKPIIRGIILLILYSFIVVVFSGVTDFLFLFKFIRALLAFLAISSFVRSCDLDCDDILSSAINVLLVNAIIVIIGAAVWPGLQTVLRPINGYNKSIFAFRSTGLTNGFDFAGLLCCFGILTTYFCDKRRFNSIRLLIFIIAAVFTSRFSMILMEAIIVYIVILNRKKERISKTLLTIVFAVSIFPILGIFLFSTNNIDNPIVSFLMRYDTFSRISKNLVYYYASGTIEDSFQDHFDFSRLNAFEIIFGSMQEAHQDPGITQFIFKIGIVGLLVTIVTYLFIIKSSLKYKIINRDLVVVITVLTLLCLVMSMKVSFLFARHVTEYLFILYFLLIIKRDSLERIKS